MEIFFDKTFDRQFKKTNSKIKNKFYKRLEIFSNDPFNSILNNHVLNGKYREYRSINITGDVRALYKTIDKHTTVFFGFIGTHSQLYR